VPFILRQEITRLARKEIRRETQSLRSVATQYRGAIAQLKRHTSKLQGDLGRMERQIGGAPSQRVSAATADKVRFTAKGLQSHRGRVGLSAADYGRLIGVTAQTIYKWEHGSARPRRHQLLMLASLRGIGKREAGARLQKLSVKPASRRKRKGRVREPDRKA